MHEIKIWTFSLKYFLEYNTLNYNDFGFTTFFFFLTLVYNFLRFMVCTLVLVLTPGFLSHARFSRRLILVLVLAPGLLWTTGYFLSSVSWPPVSLLTKPPTLSFLPFLENFSNQKLPRTACYLFLTGSGRKTTMVEVSSAQLSLRLLLEPVLNVSP